MFGLPAGSAPDSGAGASRANPARAQMRFMDHLRGLDAHCLRPRPRGQTAGGRYNLCGHPAEVHPAMLTLSKFSIGVGDRFAHQAKAQLRACMLAAGHGAEVVPVWNKSHREHTTVGSEPRSVRAAADAAVRELGWTKPYHVDADHIRLNTVDGFLDSSDFF